MRRAAPGGIPDERFLADPGEFAELVRRDVKGEIPGREGSREGAALGSYLREPGVAGRWGSILRQIEADVERQLARRQGPTEGWRGAAERFLIHVRRRLAEARRIAGAPEEALVRPGVEPWSADEAGTYERLTVVRRYLVEESRLPEPERGERREHAISALSEVMAGAASHGRAVR